MQEDWHGSQPQASEWLTRRQWRRTSIPAYMELRGRRVLLRRLGRREKAASLARGVDGDEGVGGGQGEFHLGRVEAEGVDGTAVLAEQEVLVANLQELLAGRREEAHLEREEGLGRGKRGAR